MDDDEKMSYHEKLKDFVDRCYALDLRFKELYEEESSDAVWASTMITKIASSAYQQECSNKALEQAILALTNTFNDLKEK